MQRSRRGFQAEKEYEERHEDRDGWGACRSSPRALEGRGAGPRLGGWAGWRGRTCKSMLRSFNCILQAMVRLVEILELVNDLLGFVQAEWRLPGKEKHKSRDQEEGDVSVQSKGRQIFSKRLPQTPPSPAHPVLFLGPIPWYMLFHLPGISTNLPSKINQVIHSFNLK